MGTRNLTAVKLEGKYKVAQYGQWDGYPSEQGKTALEFMRMINKKTQLGHFKNQLNNCRFITESKGKSMDKHLQKVGGELKDVYPLLTRDNGAKVLELIHKCAGDENGIIWIQNEIEFAEDSLLCEWGYVIDFDKNTFEVYKGFNKEPLDKSERFYNKGHREDNGYYPIKLVKSYDLNKLPTVNRMCKECDPPSKEE